ncbi:MAG: DNA repair exonuclease [Acidobacteriota bacterium]
MDRFRFLHAADLHLDTPMEGVAARLPAAWATRLRDASLLALDRLVETAIREQVAFVLLAGDLYDGPERGARAQVRLAQALRRMSEAGIEVLIVQGNHDPLEDGLAPGSTLPPRVTLFGSREVGRHEIRCGDRVLATVHGISYARRETRENLAQRFHRHGEGFEIGLLHAAVVGASQGHAPYAPCTLDDLQSTRLDYWALGHIHARQTLGVGSPWVVYPGNPQGRSFKPSERGAKGAVMVEVERGRVVTAPSLATLDSLRFVAAEVSIDTLPDWLSLHDAVLAAGDRLATEHAGVDLLVRVDLRGRGSLHRELAQPGRSEDLLAALRESQTSRNPRLYWVDLSDSTWPDFDPAALRARGDLLAAVLDRADALRADPAALAHQLEQLTSSLPNSVASALRRERISLDADPERTLRRALDHVVRLLDSGTRRDG